MKQGLNEIELQIALEAMKLINLERLVGLEDDKIETDDIVTIETPESDGTETPEGDGIEIPEAVVAKVIKSIEEKILYLLRSDTSPNAETIFFNTLQGSLKSDKFLRIAQDILNTHRFRTPNTDIVEKNKMIEETPESILRVMQHLAAYGNGLNDLLGSNFYSQYFLSQFLIYKTNEDRFMLDSKKINKTELYEMAYGSDGTNYVLYDKIKKVQESHKSLFKEDASLISLDTAKKRMQQVIPSKHKGGTMNQSEELNVFSQHALLIVFLIYKTSYQRFLSNPTTQRVPDSNTFEEVKKVIEEFFKDHPISGVSDELFLKTVSEDTYHFALFNALTRLTTAVLKAMNEIIEVSRQHDSLSMLFIIDQMIESTPAYTAEWIRKYEEMVTELDKFAKFPEIQQVVLDAIEDEEGLKYAKKTMFAMFEKYSTLQPVVKEFDFAENIFKNIVKDFYTSGEGKNAYTK